MNFSDMDECRKRSLVIAGLIGLVWFIVLWLVGSWGFFSSVLIGIIVAVIAGVVLMIFMCKGETGTSASGAGPSDAQSRPVAAAPVAPSADTGTVETGTAAAAADRAAEAERAVEADRAAAARAAEAADADAAKAQARAEADVAATAARAEADRTTAETAANAPDRAATAAATAPVAAAAAPVAAGAGTRPDALDGPRGGVADDLKRIKGVGPKMEIMCNELGFYHFDQIASWSAEEVAWVDQNLKGFKGRVTRDDWVEQARLLAAGGETAFSRKVDDGTVY